MPYSFHDHLADSSFHSHDSLTDFVNEILPNHAMMDVGIDATARRLAGEGRMKREDYRPLSYWDDIKPILSKKAFKPIDHHGA
tara:strand:+ start:999 stop:1247 length:249 start_codon:yes stop_codon:yes gene_type:complete